MNSNLEEIIEYIINNFKYGSELNEVEIEVLFQRYSINEECKKYVYDEIDSLKITLIPIERNDNSYDLVRLGEEEIIDDYSFLDDIEFEPLDDVFSGDEFKEDISNLNEVIDKKYNLEYIEDYKNADSDSKVRMISLSRLAEANEKLIWKVVEKYKQFATSSFDVDDMYQAGVIGLIKAAERFDISKGYQLSTYATWWIKQSISRSIMKDQLSKVNS